MKLALQDENQSIQDQVIEDPYRALAVGILVCAIRDVRVHRDRSAADWLLNEGYDWMHILDTGVSFDAWKQFIEDGCKKRRPKK